MKEQQAEMRKLGEQMRSFQNNPELKKEKELLEQASKRLHEYTQSPAFKKKMAEYRKQAYNYKYDYKYDNKYDSDAKADTTNR
jgi:hypothetical protein